MMVARLLYLDEAEKQRGYKLDEELKSAHSQSSSGRYPSGHKELNSEMDPGKISVRGGSMDDDMQSMGRGTMLFPPKDHILQPDINNSEGKNESILPSSKWAREDDESDEERDRSTRDLGLTYSSSGSENAGDVLYKTEELELTTDSSNSSHLDGGGMNEERRYYEHFFQ
ncbi:hypothetical protein C2S51_017666 [Perilla frutescens var. frutescens]|nr:hypothetical protein C2S51_017666 [Perilla frutescens var. frutescens]